MTQESNAQNGTTGVPLDKIVMPSFVSFKPIVHSVGTFTFHQDGTRAELDIKNDITPLEAVNLSVLMAQAAAASGHQGTYAWVDFIKEKELDRHFSVTEA